MSFESAVTSFFTTPPFKKCLLEILFIIIFVQEHENSVHCFFSRDA